MRSTFSQRQGIKSVSEALQTATMSRDLRNTLWNVLWTKFFVTNYLHNGNMTTGNFRMFFLSYWTEFLKEAIDQLPFDYTTLIPNIRTFFFAREWNEAYDALEFMADWAENFQNPIYTELNEALEKERSAYRFTNKILTSITDRNEVEALEEVILPSFGYSAVSAHLQRALELYSDRVNPDYRNSIKESISAVESMAKIVTNNPKAMLSDALKALEKQGQLHTALKIGFDKLYAYTNDSDGIRHAMMQEPNLTPADAKYFLLSCTSFVNYLKSKI